MAIVSYKRVSTQDKQEFVRQQFALEQRGIVADRTYEEKVSGAKAVRPVWEKCNASLKCGDTLVVESLSRIVRSTRGLLDVVYDLDQRGINLISLKENVDLSTPTGRMMAGIVSVMAQFERDVLSERITETLAAKKAAGVRLGSPRDEEKRERIRQYVSSPEWHGSVTRTAKELGVNRRTVDSVLGELKDGTVV